MAEHVCSRCGYRFYETRDGLPLWTDDLVMIRTWREKGSPEDDDENDVAEESRAEVERRKRVMQQVTGCGGNTGAPDESGVRVSPLFERLLRLPHGISAEGLDSGVA